MLLHIFDWFVLLEIVVLCLLSFSLIAWLQVRCVRYTSEQEIELHQCPSSHFMSIQFLTVRKNCMKLPWYQSPRYGSRRRENRDTAKVYIHIQANKQVADLHI